MVLIGGMMMLIEMCCLVWKDDMFVGFEMWMV